MDEKTQIEEMAKDMCCIKNICPNFCKPNENCTSMKLAKKAWEAGYFKKKKGEWKEVYRNNQATVYECTNCNHLSFGISDYCICGAKMKGGAE